jgi:uncharacterized small protein (TIGR04563 family)
MSDMKKQSIYFPEQMLREIADQGRRLDRSPSWVVQRAWMHARKIITTRPSAPHTEEIPSTSTADGRGRLGD